MWLGRDGKLIALVDETRNGSVASLSLYTDLKLKRPQQRSHCTVRISPTQNLQRSWFKVCPDRQSICIQFLQKYIHADLLPKNLAIIFLLILFIFGLWFLPPLIENANILYIYIVTQVYLNMMGFGGRPLELGPTVDTYVKYN